VVSVKFDLKYFSGQKQHLLAASCSLWTTTSPSLSSVTVHRRYVKPFALWNIQQFILISESIIALARTRNTPVALVRKRTHFSTCLSNATKVPSEPWSFYKLYQYHPHKLISPRIIRRTKSFKTLMFGHRSFQMINTSHSCPVSPTDFMWSSVKSYQVLSRIHASTTHTLSRVTTFISVKTSRCVRSGMYKWYNL
jgi:hypothetical protein